MTRRGVCLVLSAPSGAGKSTVARALLSAESDLALSISATTRAKRPGEAEGVDYYYKSEAAFRALIESGALLEWAEVYGRLYGTPRAPVEAVLQAGRDMIFDIDWQGARQLRRTLARDVVSVFLLPPSAETLRDRLVKRAGDSAVEIERRLAAAADDIAHSAEFDHVLVNDSLQSCVDDVRAVLRAARSATGRQTGLAAFTASLVGGR